jgi:hypothetical protein
LDVRRSGWAKRLAERLAEDLGAYADPTARVLLLQHSMLPALLPLPFRQAGLRRKNLALYGYWFTQMAVFTFTAITPVFMTYPSLFRPSLPR